MDVGHAMVELIRTVSTSPKYQIAAVEQENISILSCDPIM